MSAHASHADFCGWHVDQYSWECTCTAMTPEQKRTPDWLRRAAVAETSRIAFGIGTEAHGIVKPGWYCSRNVDHDGPCAAWPVSHEAKPGWEYSPESTPAGQSRADSFMESLTNIAIGLAVSQVANLIVLPLIFGVPVSGGQAFALGVIYTAISLARSYALRRAFNGRSVWSAIKVRFA